MPQKSFSPQQLMELIADIKKKKELSGVDEKFIYSQLLSVLEKNHKLAQELQKKIHPKSSAYKELLSLVRAQLRRVYGLFREAEDIKNRKSLLEGFKKVPSAKRKEVIEAILKTSAATRERWAFYEQFWEKVFQIIKMEITTIKISKKSKTIIDIGAGIHPFSLDLAHLKPLHYYAYDLGNDEVALLNDFFLFLNKQNHSFHGKAEVFDALQFEELRKLPKADVAFLLKMTDVLDRGRGHKVSEYVISAVPAKYVIVSFSTVTMSGKPMNFPERKWIELMCKRLRYDFEKFLLGKEIFYVVKK